ncbi:acyl-CoA thioesterase [Thermoleophilia bacterium SCSIO 60948]|nr:acyl-CoA thioesterase [Thermoleophilia bacterium SCSIO 60948]
MSDDGRTTTAAAAGPSGHHMRIRWADIDLLGHVNNAIALVYLDEGRDAFFKAHEFARQGYVVVRCEVDFRAEMTLADRDIWIACEALRIGESSVRTREVIRNSAGEALVEAEVVSVLWDPEARGKRAVSDDERRRLEAAGVAA